jgi:DNA-binding transcriptional MocR family regulator
LQTILPDIQLNLRRGIAELGWGHPDPALLPAADLARAAELAIRRDGWRALAYGAEQGPGPLIELLRVWLGQREGALPAAEQILVTGGVSQALDLLCTLLARPGDVVLVESPVYHLALRIFGDHGLELVPTPADAEGLRMDALADILPRLRAAGRQVCFLYTVPTFCNPTGASLASGRRSELARFALEHDLVVVEDDVYRDLWYDAPALPPLQSLAPAAVIRLGSFSKILAPGLRLGWLVAKPEIVQRCIGCGMLDSGGGVNHFTAHVVAAYLEMGLLAGHIDRLRASYRGRRDALLAGLAQYLPGDCRWQRPAGGFFAWIELPEGHDSARLLPAAEAAGVSYVPGTRFCARYGGERHLRLAFSLLSEGELATGAKRLGAVLAYSRLQKTEG